MQVVLFILNEYNDNKKGLTSGPEEIMLLNESMIMVAK